MIRTLDGGVTWAHYPSRCTSNDLYTISMDPISSVGFVAGQAGGACSSLDGGRTWVSLLGVAGWTYLDVHAVAEFSKGEVSMCVFIPLHKTRRE